ncbi:hypothetical protein BCR32DRAFT_296078 [Anaeromyces robustus]|uniref:Uncharacterized protein n=1 Tax=Anaeromyces robustus TaxID=1754192 RepID=A0A1Y1WTI7_9FUNG|nr:hypothetical protein BCR32DRAFT_296078 [Anaeromyces robustus]|eukprot:ORX76705.1 hypothetical protein BCR32DRAFT_296078 [Anaeromyces robustus]
MVLAPLHTYTCPKHFPRFTLFLLKSCYKTPLSVKKKIYRIEQSNCYKTPLSVKKKIYRVEQIITWPLYLVEQIDDCYKTPLYLVEEIDDCYKTPPLSVKNNFYRVEQFLII